MKPDFLRALQTQILAAPACAPFVHTNDMPKISGEEARAKDQAIADIISAGRTRLRSRTITERGVLSVLGTRDGEAFLSALEAFSTSILAPDHPLAADQAGIRRALGWLKSAEGIELGDQAVQAMLGALGALGIVDAQHVQQLAALAVEPDPVTVDHVSRAVRGPWGDE